MPARFETGIEAGTLPALTRVSRLLDDILNRVPDRQAPYVGASAFTHKAGLHASAILKDPATYEHVPPEAVGNARVIPMSNQAGQSNLRERLAKAGIEVRGRRPAARRASSPRSRRARTAATPTTARRRASSSWRARCSGSCRGSSRSSATGSPSSGGGTPRAALVTASEAVVVARFGAERVMSVCESHDPVTGADQGPVNALARALQEGPRAVPGLYRRHAAGRLPGADHLRRHRGGDAGADRERRPRGAALVDGRGLGEHRRRELPGAAGRDRLEAAARRRAGGRHSGAAPPSPRGAGAASG